MLSVGVKRITIDYNNPRSPGWLECVATRDGRIIYDRAAAPCKNAAPQRGKRQAQIKPGGDRP